MLNIKLIYLCFIAVLKNIYICETNFSMLIAIHALLILMQTLLSVDEILLLRHQITHKY